MGKAPLSIERPWVSLPAHNLLLLSKPVNLATWTSRDINSRWPPGGTATRPNRSTLYCNLHAAPDDWRTESEQQSLPLENSLSANRPFLFSFVLVPCNRRQTHRHFQ